MSNADGPFDLVVIGGGSAGLVAAHTAVSLGASVALIEKSRMGGDCLWTGCVPSKALISSANSAACARSAAHFRVHTEVEVDFEAVMARVRGAIRTIEPVDSPEALEAAGIEVVIGEATFEPSGSLLVDGEPIGYRQVLLGTGAAPAVPAILGIDAVSYLTSDTLWDLPEPPKRLAVIGGGAIGVELGQAFARLGTKVSIVEARHRILPTEDPDASAAVTRALIKDGVSLLTERTVTGVDSDPDNDSAGSLVHSGAGGRERVAFDQLLVATGRTPRSAGLGLENVGVEVDAHGFISVNDKMRTTNRRIWAAGDVTSHPAHTHTAGVNASVAASNAVLGLGRKISSRFSPRVTFTDPEVAAVGYRTFGPLPEGVRTATQPHNEVDRAIAEDNTDGFTRLTIGRKGRVLGGTIVGPRAGESISEITHAARNGLSTKDIANTTHPYPTYSDGVWMVAVNHVRAGLKRPATARALAAILSLRRATLKPHSPATSESSPGE